MNRPLATFLGLTLAVCASSCGKKDEPAPQAPKAAQTESPKPAAAPEAKAADTKASDAQALASAPAELGDFGSDEPIERADLPSRGVISVPIAHDMMANGMHWDQYNVPFKTTRWGRYKVRLSYTLKNATLGVQFKFGENALKKQLIVSSTARQTYIGEIYIPAAGPQFMALYTPQNVGFNTFYLKAIDLVPTSENPPAEQLDAKPLELLAKHATTWSENMRYEPKPEKDCLGFWTDEKDFAEWEFKAAKAGRYKVSILQGSATGGSEMDVILGEQKLNFKVPNTGDFHKHAEVQVGEIEIKTPGVHHLSLKPKTKNGGAIMDVKKVLLQPVS